MPAILSSGCSSWFSVCTHHQWINYITASLRSVGIEKSPAVSNSGVDKVWMVIQLW